MGWVPYQLSNGKTRVIHISTDKNGDLHYGLQMSYRQWLQYKNKNGSFLRCQIDYKSDRNRRIKHGQLVGYRRFIATVKQCTEDCETPFTAGELLNFWGGKAYSTMGPFTKVQRRAMVRKFERQGA